MKCQYGDLIHEYKKETNAKTKERMLAVINVIEKGASISLVAQMFHKVYNTVKNWVFRFERYGMSEKQRSGRPPKMTDHKITEFFTNVRNGIFPKQIVRKIKKDTGIKYTESGTHNVLRRHNFTGCQASLTCV